MQFRDLKAQYQYLKEGIDKRIQHVINETNFISGYPVLEIEQKLAEYVGVKHCITCANGTDALTMVLMAWGVKEGDAIFVPDFTFFSTAEVVSFEGATPIFVDVDKYTYNISPDKLEEAILEVLAEGALYPKAIIPVDLFGLPADYEKIRSIAQKYNLLILEDGAQGFGGKIGNNRSCSFGDAATTSFFPAKPLGCYGDGGAIFINDDDIASYLRSIRVHGKGTYKYDNVQIGMNSRLDTIQAAILLEKLDAFIKYELTDVNKIALQYTKLLKDYVLTPTIPPNYFSSWAQYTIQLTTKEKRDSLQEYLNENQIPSMVYYPKPMHKQTAFSRIKKYQEFPIASQLSNTVLSLPMHPYLQEMDVEIVCEKIRKFINSNNNN